MRPSLTTNSLLHSPSASLHQGRTASHTHSSKSHSLGGVIFCFPSSTLCCASLWFRPLGSPASSSRSSSAMVTPPSLDSYRPISLASCAFKLFEHLIYARIASHIFPQLDPSQGGFRWGADAMAFSLVDTLRLRRHEHTFVAFIDIKKAFVTPTGSKFVPLTSVSRDLSGTSSPTSCVVPCPRYVLVAPSLHPGSTLASHKAEFFLPFFSIC